LESGSTPFEALVAVDDEDLVGVMRQRVEPPQIARDCLHLRVLAHADDVEIHERSAASSGIGHRRTQLLALFDGQSLEHVMDDLVRQIRGKVGDFVGFELLGAATSSCESMLRMSVSRTAIGCFEQDFARRDRP